MGERKQRVGNVQAGLMLGTAFLIDLAQLLLGVLSIGTSLSLLLLPVGFLLFLISWGLSLVATLLFALWFIINGVPFFGATRRAIVRLTVYAATILLKLIPISSFALWWTLGIAITLVLVRLEDKAVGEEKKKRRSKLARTIKKAAGRGRELAPA